ncbi:alpha/beta hydrolase [Amycolatopsis minnesotensis]|uniref:Alpha/beta hydrolase n=1 Tax=Amycolatopsis minnesotensis TaxID=337894 RepID=A0ABN2RPG7_9PSEU
MVRIGPNTVLPAVREPVALRTADGLRLVGELALPEGREPAATVIMLHPLPTHGGSMDSHVLRKAARRLPALAGLAVLRFNTRGTESVEGRSEGSFGSAESERHDVATALDFARARALPEVWLAGWSFGTDLAVRYGLDPLVRGLVLIAPPMRWSTPEHLARWAPSGKPVTALVPEHDDFLRPDGVRERCAVLPGARVVALTGAKHLLVGHADEVLDELAAAILPGRTPLPREWPVPTGTGRA